ncbi:hypothetical protein BS78_05G056800 [Paspalum vaginatum]|nr:hypothetical protein BS78_05G056800 [Paspalum vaginatum]
MQNSIRSVFAAFSMTDLYQMPYNIEDKISDVALLGTLETGIPSHGYERRADQEMGLVCDYYLTWH